MSGRKRLSFSSSTKTTSSDQQIRGQQSGGQQSPTTLVSSSSPVVEGGQAIESTLQEQQIIEHPATVNQSMLNLIIYSS